LKNSRLARSPRGRPNMAPHRRADGAITDGVVIEPNPVFISHALGIVITSAAGIGVSVAAALAAGAEQCIVFADGGAVRFTLDGTNPTATSGIPIAARATFTYGMADAAAAKFIQATGSSAVLDALFTM
jgi:hypothetical protein